MIMPRKSAFQAIPVMLCFAPFTHAADIGVRQVQDYVFGGYRGEFQSPPQADGNPRNAIVVSWSSRPYRFVFSHEGSYCPWFELADGSGTCFQFFEGNDGWAELFNQFGRMEKNSFVDVAEHNSRQAHIRWTYYGVNQEGGARAYMATEDFYCLANGLVLREQIYKSLMFASNEGYAREPIELIGMCPVGKLWKDVLQSNDKTDERHALAALDPFSANRYDVYWKPDPKTLWKATAR